MEKMDVDEAVVDLSISSNRSASPAPQQQPQQQQQQQPMGIVSTNSAQSMVYSRRVLRPRTEPRSYVESPDVLINGTLDKPRTNGNADYSSDSSEGEMPPLAPIKELSPSELKQRDRGLRRLREDLRAEEMKLVLLKKLKQSQQLKENVAVLPPSIPQSALPPTGLPSGLSITPTTVKVPSNKNQPPQSLHSRHPNSHKTGQGSVPSLLRGQPPPARSSIHAPPLSGSPLSSRGANLSVPQPPQRSSLGRPPSGFPPGVKDLSPSVTITPAPPQPSKDRSRDDGQTPAQRQAAAKLALRKQLEKTLLQIPPPKPPPPEMHFIPNPSNTEFIYLVGLEHVVDFLTKETRMPLPPMPFSCSQCNSDFTPVWKWETKGKNRGIKVICEQCVTNNVKKALKAEHTNRLKTAFVKALQQEQEIEQRLAQNGVFTSSSPAPSPVTPEAVPKSATPTPTPRHAATPPAPSAQQTPPPSRSSHSSSDKFSQNAAMQALQQQLLRSLTAGAPPAHMLPFSPLFYPYQMAIAQAAASGKGGTPNMAELQRAAELQRQYLLDMIPPGPGQRHNWKT
ncbi:transcriptional repressor p66-alpha isoform X2 [Tribolium castaneum]|nr:PREDICTED: transcriptional repressor p66-alpha isoform X1 [Tribolium castaneum]|eukprot:XP_008195574.1 PREDICTED: transcriptional repressor p66-alpha isoform X1 [Tribolium castaneum]